MRAWRYSILLGAVAALTACGSGTNVLPEQQGVQKRLALESFNSCQDLESYIEDTAVLDMRSQLEQAKQGYGWGPVYAMGGAEDAAAPQAGASADKSAGPNDYTTTNTQVAGVDEADFVKNDGNRIFVLSGDTLYLNQSWPAAELKTVSTVKLEGWPREMFLDDQNHVVVFSGIWDAYPLDRSQGTMACASLWCGYYYANTVKMTVVDVSDLAQPKVTEEVYLPGYYSNSRRVGSSVRVVLSDNFRWPEGVQWWVNSSDTSLYQDKARLAKAYDELMKKNEAIIRAAKLTDWLPYGKRRLADGSMVDVSYDCHDFYKSNAPTRLGLVTVATLNLAHPEAVSRTSIVAESGEIYASAKSLYVASQHWWWWPQPGQADYTYLHKFDITDPDRAVYVASGGVEGHIVDQFSMDEDPNGFFRVATTISTRVADPQHPDWWWGTMQTTNKVSVLAEDHGALNVVGQTGELAPGERIQSSRFIGDTGYVVTFRQVDPLFTIDLKDPTHPTKLGELTIPGFSSYIHPLDATHLLTLGTYLDPNGGNWQTRAVQLAIYDVSDPAHPKQTFTQKVGSAYGWSEALWEHKAFNYFPAKKLLAIPFYDYNPNSSDYWSWFVSDLRVFSVDAQTGFTPKGSVSLKDVYFQYGDNGWTWYWSPWVRRSVMADDFVYAISDAGIRVANVNDLSTPLATALFHKASEH